MIFQTHSPGETIELGRRLGALMKGGDIIVRAALEGTDWTPAELKATYAECVTVLAVTDNRRAPNAKHWRVTGT